MPAQEAPDQLDRLRPALADRYRIESELGRGGMATVYLAEDLRHGRQVAIKVLHPQLAGAGYEPARFLQEIRTAARLSHPQILPLHDSGTFEWGPGVPGLYFVMPYAGCESIRDRLRQEGRLPVDDAIRIARTVAAALDYAHRRDVLHRDIKPENILLQEGLAVVSDFGIARAISASAAGGAGALGGAGGVGGAGVLARENVITAGGIAIGTPAYMSPEQASADRQLDGRSDIYSLACVLYEMLVGEPPFAGSGARATMARHAIEPPPSVRVRRPEVSVAVDAALAKALAKEPADRFATAGDFADALSADADSGTFRATGPRMRGARALAVLPFVNASPDPENEYFSDGMTDELINALTQVEGLQVASRTSVFALKGTRQDVRAIGALLGVSSVLEGTVRRSGRRLRITAQLTCTTDGRNLWSGRYDREVEDIFAIQDEIAGTIVDTLRANLVGDLGDPTPKRYTDSLTAYNLYLKGRYWWNSTRTQEGIAEGIRYFEQAIEADAGYALAYTGLADSYALHVDYRNAPVAEGMRRAKELAQQALELDDTLAEAHTSLAWVVFIYDWEWERAERHFRRALALNPRYATARQWYAWLLVAMNRCDEALVEGRAAVELDPTSVSIRRSLGWLYYYARQYDLAVEHTRRAIAMNPTADESHYVLGLCYARQGLLDQAEASLREAIASTVSNARSIAALGYVAALRGRPEETRRKLAELSARARERYVSPGDFVVLHLALNEIDSAFEWLERAYEQRRGWLAYLKVEPKFDTLRGDPRFDDLLRRMRLA